MNLMISHPKKQRKAFALILAIVAMAFMVMLTLTLSSIISSKLRLLTAQKESRMARQNAMLGLSAAISSLQTTLGKDNAVSANATILDTDPDTVRIDGVQTPYVVGAFNVRKDAQGEDIKEWQDANLEISKNLRYGRNADANDVEWLISSERRLQNPQVQSIQDLSDEVVKLATYKALDEYPDEFGGNITKDHKSEEVEVLAGKIKMAEGGAYAWWVSDESQKAKINLMRPEKYLDNISTGDAASFEAPSDRFIPQFSNIGFLEELSNMQLNPFLPSFSEDKAQTIAKMSSLDEFAILDPTLEDWSKENKADYTTVSVGIPVDVTQGKLKEDLSAYIFSNASGVKDTDTIIRGGPSDKNYTGPKLGVKNYTNFMPRMGLLKGYATIVSDRDKGKNSFETYVEPQGQVSTTGKAQHGIFPIISCVMWTFQLAYEKTGTDEVDLYLYCYPKVKIWNPHNVAIKSGYILKVNFPYVLQTGVKMDQSKDPCSNESQDWASKSESVYSNYYCPAMAIDEDLRDVYINKQCQEISAADYNSKTDVHFKYQPRIPLFVNGAKAEGCLTIDMSDIIKSERTLKRGSSPHSENKGTSGTPAVCLAIPEFTIYPGENIELNLNEQNGVVDYVERGGHGTLGSTSTSAYPQLTRGNINKTSGNSHAKIENGFFRINLNTKLKPAGSGVNSTGFTHSQMQTSSLANARVCAAWIVYKKPQHAYNTYRNNEPTASSEGYELYRAGTGEYLTSQDFGHMESGGDLYGAKPMNDAYYADSGHQSAYHAAYNKFATNYAWDPQTMAMSKTDVLNAGFKYLNDYYGLGWGSYDFNYDWQSESGTPINERKYYGYIKNNKPSPTASYVYPEIPRRQDLDQGLDLYNSYPYYGNNKRGVFYKNQTLASGSATAGKSVAYYCNLRSDQTNGETTAKPKAQIHALTSTGKHAYSPGWELSTLLPTKKYFSSNHYNNGDNQKTPQIIQTSNFMRNSGEALRVNKSHGYNTSYRTVGGVPPSNNNQGEIFFKSQTASGLWPNIYPSDLGSRWEASSQGDNDWKWQNTYKSHADSDTLYSPVLMDMTGPTGKNDNQLAHWSVISPVFDYPRSEKQVLSLGIFSHANLSMMPWQPTYPFGESFPSVFVSRDKIVDEDTKVLYDNELIDISYMLNYSMWDRFYLSTVPKEGLGDIRAGMRLQNTRNFITVAPDEKRELVGDDAFEKSAKYVGIDGAFNVNSTSYEAWRALLGALLGTKKQTILEDEYPKQINADDPEKFYMPNPGNINPLVAPQKTEDGYCFGYRDVQAGRSFSAADIDRLAREIVAEVKRRAPFFSLADFVNRRLISYSDASSDDDLTYQSLMGTIAAAIDRVSKEFENDTGTEISTFQTDGEVATEKISTNTGAMSGYKIYKDGQKTTEFAEHLGASKQGNRFKRFLGWPGYMPLQSQILQAIGPVITPRGDTFTVRSYGEYKNTITGDTSKAYCEAVVQRVANPVDPTDDAVSPKSEFGRKFKIVSFRWLTPAEL